MILVEPQMPLMILVEPLRFAHGGLDVQTLDVLPVLLQQRHEEVHGKADVLHQLLLRHVHVTDLAAPYLCKCGLLFLIFISNSPQR